MKLRPQRLSGVIDTNTVASMLPRGEADAGLPPMTGVLANPGPRAPRPDAGFGSASAHTSRAFPGKIGDCRFPSGAFRTRRLGREHFGRHDCLAFRRPVRTSHGCGHAGCRRCAMSSIRRDFMQRGFSLGAPTFFADCDISENDAVQGSSRGPLSEKTLCETFVTTHGTAPALRRSSRRPVTALCCQARSPTRRLGLWIGCLRYRGSRCTSASQAGE